MRKSRFMPLMALVTLLLPAYNSTGQNNKSIDRSDTTFYNYTVGQKHARKPIVIDVENLKAPQKLLDTLSYDLLLDTYYFTGDTESIVSHNRLDRQLVMGGQNPFFKAMYHAYADHRPFELSPEALWLLICQGFSYHVNNNAEDLRPMFVDFDGKKTLSVNTNRFPENPEAWERLFPQFTKQIASYTGKELVSVMGSDFTTSTSVSHTATQITIMVAMKKYFDYELTTICGIPQVILHGAPEDWQSIIDRVKVLREYKLAWWVDEMLPVLEKIKRASEGEVDKDFWRNMFKYHNYDGYLFCGASSPDIDGWIVKFYPYDEKGRRNDLEILYEGDQHLPSEVLSVPLKIDAGAAKTTLTLRAGFVGIAQDSKTLALRPEIGWLITERKK